MMLATGEQPETLSGRKTTPFPKVSLDTKGKALNTFKRCNLWLIQNAYDEAVYRCNGLAQIMFRCAMGYDMRKLPQADKDLAHTYLFGNTF